jgi:predicted DNA-binding transcriptional regulator AlpA
MTARVADLARLPDWPRQLSRPQAAAYLGLSPATLDQAIRNGTYPPGVKVGGRTFWDRKGLDAAVDKIHGTGTIDADAMLARLDDPPRQGNQAG